MSNTWSIDDYCKAQLLQHPDWSNLPVSSRQFLESFQLPSLHPFCEATKLDEFYSAEIPSMGPLLQEDYHHHVGDVIMTHLYRVLPALLAMAELWLRLFASALAPVGIAYLMHQEFQVLGSTTTTISTVSTDKDKTTRISSDKHDQKSHLSAIIVLTVASSVVLMTDTLYVLEYGPRYGITLLILSSILAWRSCSRHHLTKTLLAIVCLKMLAGYLIYDPNSISSSSSYAKVSFGDPLDAVTNVQEGLYYNSNNEFIQKVVDAWPEPDRTYSPANGATPWMPTGDSRTGFPFLLNKIKESPTYQRLWLETVDHEYVALDVALPVAGHSSEKPLYLVLHGLNGGSHEEYVMEFTHRRLQEGSTVVVLVARGLMDLPIKGWNIFHGARVDDVDVAAKALRQVTGERRQTLAAVGYSMGAIILSNYVARSGSNCPLDAAVAISGGLDMRFEHNFVRAQRLWQPMLTQELRDSFLVNKWGERVRARLSLDDMRRSMRAVHVTEIDTHAVAPYNRFDNVTHYYMEMSALGDIPMEHYQNSNHLPQDARIHNVAIPFCVIHALDDPLVTWRTVAANQGLMHPRNLTQQIHSGNLLLLLTKAGGHIGWPLGWAPFIDKWKWMNDAAMTFVQAVNSATDQYGSESLSSRQCLSDEGASEGTCSNI